MPEFDREQLLKKYMALVPKINSVLNDILTIVLNSGQGMEGNCFYKHASFDICPALFNKQFNLFWCGSQGKAKICEIGFNAGHSALLLLLGSSGVGLDFTIFDIGRHKYTKPALKYMIDKFPGVKFQYIEGDSTKTMTAWTNEGGGPTYDLVHVDGGHTEECIKSDMRNADLIVCVGGIVIVDDTDSECINSCFESYISSGRYEEVEILKTTEYPHRVCRKLKNIE